MNLSLYKTLENKLLKQAIICLTLSFSVSIGYFFIRDKQYEYSATIQFPKMYIFDSYFEILPLLEQELKYQEFRDRNYYRLKMELEQEILKKTGFKPTFSLTNGLLRVSYTSTDGKYSRKVVSESTKESLAIWQRKIDHLKKPLQDYIKKLENQIRLTEKEVRSRSFSAFAMDVFVKRNKNKQASLNKLKEELEDLKAIAYDKKKKELFQHQLKALLSENKESSPPTQNSAIASIDHYFHLNRLDYPSWAHRLSFLVHKPLHNYLLRIERNLLQSERLLKAYEGLNGVQSEKALAFIAKEEKIRIENVLAQLSLMRDLAKLSLSYVKEPSLASRVELVNIYKPSLVKSIAIFLILSTLSLGIIINQKLTRIEEVI